ncbi:hypothetical protein DFH29DRAFT_996725 [Suillus ampliporus]|nr:hypothetical protein DFH29DRAFT_996725 [Suillus ampliporus]
MGNRLNLETLLTQAVKIHRKPLLDPQNHMLLQHQSLMMVSLLTHALLHIICYFGHVLAHEYSVFSFLIADSLLPATNPGVSSRCWFLLLQSLLDTQASPPNASDALGTSPATTRAPMPVCASEHNMSPLVPTIHEDDQDEDEEMLDEFADVCEDKDLEHDPVDCGLAPDPDLAATAKQKVHSTMPMWLASEYQNLQERLVCEMRSNSSHLPMCYDHHTFFDGAENAFLVARSTFQLTPGLFHQPQFFVWLLHLLVDHIPCPSCLKAGHQVHSWLSCIPSEAWFR